LDEVGVGWLTRSAWSKKYGFSTEDLDKLAARERRFTTGSTTSAVGPGTYHDDLLSPSLNREFNPVYTVPKSGKGGERPLPREVSAADHLGPGTYEMPNRFNEIGWRKTEKMEKAAKRSKDSWAQKEYSHIFNCMKPRHKSVPLLPASGGH